MDFIVITILLLDNYTGIIKQAKMICLICALINLFLDFLIYLNHSLEALAFNVIKLSAASKNEFLSYFQVRAKFNKRITDKINNTLSKINPQISHLILLLLSYVEFEADRFAVQNLTFRLSFSIKWLTKF